MAYVAADDIPVHQYASFGGEAEEGKSTLKPFFKRYAAVCSVTVALALVGVMGSFGFTRQQGFVNLLEANANVQAQALGVAEQLKEMRSDPEQLKGAQLLAQALAEGPQLDESAAQHLQAWATRVADQIKELLANPEFAQEAKRVAMHMKAVLGNPVVQEEAKRYTDQMSTVVASMYDDQEVPARRLTGITNAGVTGLRRASVAGGRTQILGAPQPSRYGPRDVSMGINERGQRTKFKLYGPVEPKQNTNPNKVAIKPVEGKPAPMPSSKQVADGITLSKLGELRVLTFLSEQGLLSAAEKAGVFSSLEKQGAFSKAEELLPVLDDIGALGLLEFSLGLPSGLVSAPGFALVAVGPLYGALIAAGVIEAPQGTDLIVPGLLITGSTGVGALIITAGNILGQVQKR
jgi:hypothetical protein